MRSRRVNDTHGHAAGDAVLKDVAYILRRELRAYDLAYRVGGEEFLVLLPGTAFDAMRVTGDADAALYQPKAAGRNCVRVAQPAASQIAA